MSLDRVLQPLVACLGNPVGGNPTQFVMTRLAREAELDWRFFTSQVPPELFETAFRGIQALGMSGAAILPPFQASAQALLGSVSPKSKAIGAVQVVKWESDQWIGDETISSAILRSLTHKISLRAAQEGLNSDEAFTPQSIAVVGSSGLVQALELALAEIPGDYSVFALDLTIRKTKPPTPELSPHALSSQNGSIGETAANTDTKPQEPVWIDRPIRALIIEQFDAIIHTSSQSRHRLLKDLHWSKEPVGILVPPPTGWIDPTKERSQWIEELESHQIERIDELEVLTHQFAINFEFWTGYEAPLDSIRESLEEYLQW
jgi:shikimate dehydrogenase